MNKNLSKIIILSNFSLGCCPLLHLLLLLLLLLLSSTSTTTFYTFFLPTIGKNVLMSLVHLINLCNFSINPFFFFSLFSSSSSSSYHHHHHLVIYCTFILPTQQEYANKLGLIYKFANFFNLLPPLSLPPPPPPPPSHNTTSTTT